MSKELTRKCQDNVKKSHNMTENEQKIGKNTQYEQKKCLSLTEQWRNGKLNGLYYMLDYTGKVVYRWLNGIRPDADFIKGFKEVLDKVPDYDEYKQMEEQINNLQKMLEYECSKRCELEAQLAEANEIIRFYANTDGLTEEEKQMSAEKYHLVYGLKANDYLEKHGVEK